MDMKYCSKCTFTKYVKEFQLASASKDGLQNWCRSCMSDYAKDRPKRVRDPLEVRRLHLTGTYGITPERFDELLAEQGGTCATCTATPETSTRNFCVDHDHSCCPGVKSCGACVRGVLCVRCNTALGQVNDSIEVLENLVNYLALR